MATRSYNGQEYQSATCEVSLTTPDGFEFRLQTWQDLKLKIGRKKKVTNRADATIDGWTSELVATEAGGKIRKSEWDKLVDALYTNFPGAEIDTILLTLTVIYGNSLQVQRKDVAEVLLEEINRDLPRSQEPLMVDLPMTMISLVENGIPRFQSAG
jgi:hypothetical protein